MNEYQHYRDGNDYPFIESNLIQGIIKNITIDNKILNVGLFVDRLILSLDQGFLFNIDTVNNLVKHYKINLVSTDKDGNVDRSIDNLATILSYQIIYIANKIGYRLAYVWGNVYFYDGKVYKQFKYECDTEDTTSIIKLILEVMIANKISTKQLSQVNKIVPAFINALGRDKMDISTANYLALQNKVITIQHRSIKAIDNTPDIFITNYADYEYNPDAECPMFTKFLDEIIPNKNIQNVLQEFVGYCLSDGFSLEKMLILYGNGANGKSVFQNIISAMIGYDNVSTHGLDELISGNHQDNTRFMTFTKKVNVGSEIGNLRDASIDMLKKMISNEHVMVRKMRSEPFSVKWKPKLIFNANNMPSSEVTRAYERRIIVIPFDVTIQKEKRDPMLASKIISKELSGILNWALTGLMRIFDNNMKLTECIDIEASTKSHIDQTNSVIDFLQSEEISPAKPSNLEYNAYRLKELMELYVLHMKSIGGIPKQYKTFEATLALNGFTLVKSTSTSTKLVLAKIPRKLGIQYVTDKYKEYKPL